MTEAPKFGEPSFNGAPAIFVPEGYKLHSENSAHILLPDTADAFLNPVQEFNRDLSVACIRVWSEEMNENKKERFEKRGASKRKSKGKRAAEDITESVEGASKKAKLDNAVEVTIASESSECAVQAAIPEGDDTVMQEANAILPSNPSENKVSEFRPQKIVILEALSATGLRSIRYAKEIPLVRHVIANDLSPAATAAMRRNVEINNLGPQVMSSAADAAVTEDHKDVPNPGKVRINEGDACDLMYSHRPEKQRVDVVDLDPYGTAAPFIDAAVQCIKDDGLLCVTCTDLSVLASANYPEKCFSNYGGIPAKAEYCHEVALRLVLHTLSTSAARYGRFITPLLSLSIDFYVRLFVRVRTAPIEVKKAMTKTSLYHVCTSCQSWYPEQLGRIIEKRGGNGVMNPLYKTAPSSSNTDTCEECNSKLHVAGPMWSGPIHDPEFVKKVLGHIEEKPSRYNTNSRMKGMLTLAAEELDTPFYLTPARVSSHFHCECPSLEDTASAILNAGYPVSRSHACPGSIKSPIPRTRLHDIIRTWILDHPVKMEKIKEESAKVLLAKPLTDKADFTKHPGLDTFSSKIRVVRYPHNPAPNWGPGARPDSGKRKKANAEAETT